MEGLLLEKLGVSGLQRALARQRGESGSNVGGRRACFGGAVEIGENVFLRGGGVKCYLIKNKEESGGEKREEKKQRGKKFKGRTHVHCGLLQG